MGIKIGDKVGSYRVLRPLGQGGMGTVFEVEHERLGVHFALKAFTLADGDRAFFRKRFFAEGRILARLDDPHVVRVVDLDVEPQSDTPYFVMDLVQGPDGTPDAAVLADLNWRIARHQAAVAHVFSKSALGEQARRVYVLSKTEGLSAAEIATRIGIKPNAVRAILSRVERMISAVEDEYD